MKNEVESMNAGPVQRTFAIHGSVFEARWVWECACSGDGHPVGEPNAKCYRKGGESRQDLFEKKTGRWAGWKIPEDYRDSFIKDGWEQLNNGYLLHPDFVPVKA